ncbi:hypothetical protein D3C77_222250 [compost metagenome]
MNAPLRAAVTGPAGRSTSRRLAAPVRLSDRVSFRRSRGPSSSPLDARPTRLACTDQPAALPLSPADAARPPERRRLSKYASPRRTTERLSSAWPLTLKAPDQAPMARVRARVADASSARGRNVTRPSPGASLARYWSRSSRRRAVSRESRKLV